MAGPDAQPVVVRRGRARPMLVSLSGIDGSGKSSHVTALLDALAGIDVPAGVVTARIGRLTPLRRIVHGLRRMRSRARSRGSSGGASASSGGRTVEGHWKGWQLTAWAIATAIDYGLWLQHVRWRLASGGVIVADRYLCDFAVEFNILVESQPRLRAVLLAVIQKIAPQPRLAYYLRIPADLSVRRKPDDQHGYDHARVVAEYDRLAGSYRLKVVDNSADFERVAASIIDEVKRRYREIS